MRAPRTMAARTRNSTRRARASRLVSTNWRRSPSGCSLGREAALAPTPWGGPTQRPTYRNLDEARDSELAERSKLDNRVGKLVAIDRTGREVLCQNRCAFLDRTDQAVGRAARSQTRMSALPRRRPTHQDLLSDQCRRRPEPRRSVRRWIQRSTRRCVAGCAEVRAPRTAATPPDARARAWSGAARSSSGCGRA